MGGAGKFGSQNFSLVKDKINFVEYHMTKIHHIADLRCQINDIRGNVSDQMNDIRDHVREIKDTRIMSGLLNDNRNQTTDSNRDQMLNKKDQMKYSIVGEVLIICFFVRLLE